MNKDAAKTNFDSVTEIGNFCLHAKQTKINLSVKFIFGVEQIFSPHFIQIWIVDEEGEDDDEGCYYNNGNVFVFGFQFGCAEMPM